jgi:hypothetical protein
LFLLLDSGQLRCDNSDWLLAPENDAHVEGTDADQQDREDVGHQQYQDVVAEKTQIVHQ